MMGNRYLWLVATLSILLPGASHAGPNFNFEFVPFLLTRENWNENTLGSDRTVLLRRGASEGEIQWNVRFHSKRPAKEFTSLDGNSSVSAPKGCESAELRVTSNYALERARDGIPVAINFSKLGDRSQFVNPEPWDGNRVVVPHFLDYVDKSKPKVRLHERRSATCEALRNQCAETPGEQLRLSHVGGMNMQISQSAAPLRVPLCSEVENAVARCLAEQPRIEALNRAKLAEYEQRRRCMALVVPSRGFTGGIELRIVGGDGLEWEPIRIEPPKITQKLRAYALAPVTVVGDAILMTAGFVFWGAFAIAVAISA